jgi:hypothetical protein
MGLEKNPSNRGRHDSYLRKLKVWLPLLGDLARRSRSAVARLLRKVKTEKDFATKQHESSFRSQMIGVCAVPLPAV